MSDTTKIKSNDQDYLFKEDFNYKHDNPYHEKLAGFEEFVLRDTEGESFKGKWSKQVFGNDNPNFLEVGTGFGHFMLEHTEQNPNINFIGMDHRFKRSYQLAKKLEKLKHRNFKYLRARGERLNHLFGENELEGIYYFFPDPWPKNRHHKKRLFQKSFLDQVHTTLSCTGEFQLKTDHLEYFEWMVRELSQDSRFECLLKTNDLREEYPDHFLASFKTKFEKIFLKKGIKINALTFRVK